MRAKGENRREMGGCIPCDRRRTSKKQKPDLHACVPQEKREKKVCGKIKIKARKKAKKRTKPRGNEKRSGKCAAGVMSYYGARGVLSPRTRSLSARLPVVVTGRKSRRSLETQTLSTARGCRTCHTAIG